MKRNEEIWTKVCGCLGGGGEVEGRGCLEEE